MEQITFDQLGIAPSLLDALTAKGYTHPSPIQAATIPVLLSGRDMLACAQTGTGKTASFALPILQHIDALGRKPKPHEIRALVLAPTRELATQVGESFKDYGKDMKFAVALVHGGVNQFPQVKALRRGIDVLVATPGRLIDLYNQGHVDFSGVTHFVLDEADRMLDMGFVDDIRSIAEKIPSERTTIMFSATMAPPITKLANTLLRNPEEIRIQPEVTTAERVSQELCFVKSNDRLPLLVSVLKSHEAESPEDLSIIFSKTRHGAEKLEKFLMGEGFAAESIHGGKSQNARDRILKRFKSGRTGILIATDVAARGIDVKNISLVINYDLPMEAENYVHRIGRTARAGASGVAISFCCGEDLPLLRGIEKIIKTTIEVNAEHPFHDRGLADRHLNGGRSGSGDGARNGGGGGYRQRRSGARPQGGGFNRSPRASDAGRRNFGGRRPSRTA